MGLETVIASILGLVVVLAILIFLLFFTPSKKIQTQPIQTEQKQEIDVSLKSLAARVKSKTTTTNELAQVLALILKHHGKIHPHLGSNPHPDLAIYLNIMFILCIHPNTSKDVIIDFNKELARLNPEYKKEIDEALTKGLASRGS